MKAAVIGASEEALHTIHKAHAYGLEVTALDGNPAAAGLKAADEGLVVDISDECAVIEALKKEKPDFILTVPIGRYLTATGAANDALGLPGISREMAVLCTDKFKFHQRLWENGLRNCHCYKMGRDICKTELSFPAILKPRYGSGSRGIHMVTDREGLKEALEAVSDEPYVLEECVDGEEYGVDGAVTKAGFQMILLRRKENTPPPARQAVGYFSVLPSDGFWQQVEKYMSRVVEVLGLKECLLHADVIRSGEGPFVIELSARPSGHQLHNLFTPLCTGVDMAEEYIRYRIGLPCCFTPQNTKSMMIHYFDMQGRARHIPEIEQVKKALDAQIVAWKCNIRENEVLGAVSDGHSIMSRGYFILEGGDDLFLHSQGERIKELFGCEEAQAKG